MPSTKVQRSQPDVKTSKNAWCDFIYQVDDKKWNKTVMKGNEFSGNICRNRHLGEQAFLQCSRTQDCLFLIYVLFFPWSLCLLTESNIPLKNIFINVRESGHGSKDPLILSHPQKVLWNFKSVFIIDCLEAELGAQSNCQLNPNSIWLVSWLRAISSIMQCCCQTKCSFRYRSRDKWSGFPLFSPGSVSPYSSK